MRESEVLWEAERTPGVFGTPPRQRAGVCIAAALLPFFRVEAAGVAAGGGMQGQRANRHQQALAQAVEECGHKAHNTRAYGGDCCRHWRACCCCGFL